MNRKLVGAFFKRELDRVDNQQCPICSSSTADIAFKDQKSADEFIISGMCQPCQDNIFAATEED